MKLLHLFYSNPNRSFYVREITRKIDEQINSVRRELANLLSIGIISSDNNNNKLYYEVEQNYEYYDPLELIFGTGKTAKSKTITATIATDVERDDLRHLGNVELALFTGAFTRDDQSGIDLLIVGDINQTQLTKYIAGLEKKEGRDLRYVLLSLDEYKYREQINDKFVAKIKASKKQILVDKAHLLTDE